MWKYCWLRHCDNSLCWKDGPGRTISLFSTNKTNRKMVHILVFFMWRNFNISQALTSIACLCPKNIELQIILHLVSNYIFCWSNIQRSGEIMKAKYFWRRGLRWLLILHLTKQFMLLLGIEWYWIFTYNIQPSLYIA